MTVPLPTKPTFQFRPPSESDRQAAAAKAVAAYRRGEEVPPSPVVPVVQVPQPAPAETVIELAPGIELVETPAPQSKEDQPAPNTRLSAIDALTPDELAQFQAGTLTLVFDCPKALTQAQIDSNVAIYRRDPLFFDVPIRADPETGAEGK